MKHKSRFSKMMHDATMKYTTENHPNIPFIVGQPLDVLKVKKITAEEDLKFYAEEHLKFNNDKSKNVKQYFKVMLEIINKQIEIALRKMPKNFLEIELALNPTITREEAQKRVDELTINDKEDER